MENGIVILLLCVNLALLGWMALRPDRAIKRLPADLLTHLKGLAQGQDRLERALREELAQNRQEAASTARHQREEITHTLMQLVRMNEQRMDALRALVEQKLTQLQEDNGRRLEQMRATVDEKLHATLERRLGESFKLVSDRLEQVQKGLGEMQVLAAGVGDLKRVLSNVKTRGILGEVRLESLLEQMLAPDQYVRDVAPRPDSAERVEFAVRIPAKDDDAQMVLLPIDAKFPMEDYQRLLDAQDAGDPHGATEAARQLEARIKACAKDIHDKYIHPPYTTDFAILFLPVEGLFAEALRRSGLMETIQRDYRVTLAGPTTLAALLNSLQMGFRTLAIQKRSSEVWQLLGAVKTEFGKFGAILDKTHKKLQEASHTIEEASRKTRTIERRLRHVEALPTGPTTMSDADPAAAWLEDEQA
ncbi:MAG: DNA recombination protein RmuC [Alicyclobacillus sp.]|nr:DNA recombination protein RmuC [Alicyclobacillus sp.]